MNIQPLPSAQGEAHSLGTNPSIGPTPSLTTSRTQIHLIKRWKLRILNFCKATHSLIELAANANVFQGGARNFVLGSAMVDVDFIRKWHRQLRGSCVQDWNAAATRAVSWSKQWYDQAASTMVVGLHSSMGK